MWRGISCFHENLLSGFPKKHSDLFKKQHSIITIIAIIIIFFILVWMGGPLQTFISPHVALLAKSLDTPAPRDEFPVPKEIH